MMSNTENFQTGILPEVIALLNDQVKQEAQAAANYLAMASWCENEGFEGSADFLYRQSEEERSHMLKIFRYINEVGGKALSPPTEKSENEYSSLKVLFQQVLMQEKLVTQSIHRLVMHCLSINDFNTFEFMQWFINEQREEEAHTQKILDLFKIIGEEGMALYKVDKAIQGLKK